MDLADSDTWRGPLRVSFRSVQWEGVCGWWDQRLQQRRAGIRRSDQHVVDWYGGAKCLPAGRVPAGGTVPVCGGRVQPEWAWCRGADLGVVQRSAAKSACCEQHEQLSPGHEFGARCMDDRACLWGRESRLWASV